MALSDALDYLSTESFMADAVKARALAAAFELGLIDFLAAEAPVVLSALREKFGCDDRGLGMLLHLLRANGVVEDKDGLIRLTRVFLKALRYRDIMETKLALAGFVLHDLGDHFTSLIANPESFHTHARTFGLFSYDRCLQDSRENRDAAKRWMAITTVLTKYEAPVCMEYYDFSLHRRMLDIGGNSGEFARQVCMRHPAISALVMDLPVVCRVGAEYMEGKPEGGRVRFFEGNGLADPIPRGFDLVSFKSMLHDWPDREATRFLAKAVEALEPGGALLIFERSPLEADQSETAFSTIPFLLFFRSFRDSSWYEKSLRKFGLKEITTTKLRLDTPFHIISGRR